MHSKDWPRCPNCGDYALEGQATCGRSLCVKELQQGQGESGLERIRATGRRTKFWTFTPVTLR